MSHPYLLCDVLLVLSPHTHYMYINFIHIITLKQQQQQQKPHMYEELKKYHKKNIKLKLKAQITHPIRYF